MPHTIVIAEAGVNHNGDLQIAKELIDAAASAGADYIKFQTFQAKQLVAHDAPKAEYQRKHTANHESQLEMIEKLELTLSDHHALIEYCQLKNISFFSTAFENKSLDLLMDLGIDRIKVPSGEITNVPFLEHIGEQGKPIILSTGMAKLGEIENAIEIFESKGIPRDQICVLHCNTAYPTPYSDVNLMAMVNVRNAFQVNIGYSDHTDGIEIPIAAVALGASVIEKHLTLDRNLPGPDHKASLEPAEFAAMIKSIKNIEVALGDGVKRPSPSEIQNKAIVRKSIVAATDISKGDILTESNLAFKRPGTGLDPSFYKILVGRAATRAYKKDELIEL